MKLKKSQRAQVFAMFGGRCAYCGTPLPETGWHADHVEPIIRKTKIVRHSLLSPSKFVQTGECYMPGNERLDNFMPSCRPCNLDKSALSLDAWRKSLEHKVQVLRDNHSAWRHAERFGLVAQIADKVSFYFEVRLEGR